MTTQSNFFQVLQGNRPKRGLIWGILILMALLAFELFNYSTTDFAMTDLLGDLRFAGIRWATILAVAFCGIDFAGIARLFTPEQGADEPMEVWYLFGAWLLAATMNAMLTWWGVSIAIISHNTLGNAVIPRETLLKVVPIFVAIMVWLIRVLIIGTFSVAGERLFSQAETRSSSRSYSRKPAKKKTSRKPAYNTNYRKAPVARSASYSQNKPRTNYRPVSKNTQPELTYEPMQMKSRNGYGYNRSNDQSG